MKEHFWLPPDARVTIDLFYERLHPEDRERTRAALDASLANKCRYEIDYRTVAPDGRVKWIRAIGHPHYDADGQPIRFDGVTMDVTRAEESRRGAPPAHRPVAGKPGGDERQRRLYHTILSNTPDLAYVFDLNHRFTYANDVLLRMWGKSWEEAIGKTCLELGYEPWHAEMHNREIDQVAATGLPVRGEVPFAGTFGRRIYDYILVPVFDADGKVEAVAGTTRDVTERKSAEVRNRFLVGLDDALRPLADPGQIVITAARLLGEHLQVDRCAYADVESDERYHESHRQLSEIAGDQEPRGPAEVLGLRRRRSFASCGKISLMSCTTSTRTSRPSPTPLPIAPRRFRRSSARPCTRQGGSSPPWRCTWPLPGLGRRMKSISSAPSPHVAGNPSSGYGWSVACARARRNSAPMSPPALTWSTG